MTRQKNMLEELNSGREEAFKLFFYTYYPRLVTFSSLILSDTQLAEDLVQEFFIDFWEKKTYKRITSLDAYIYYSIKNSSLNALRAKKHKAKRISKMLAEKPDDFTVHATEKEEEFQLPDIAILYNAIDRLPPARKKIFELCYFKHYKYQQVATAMNLSINTVKVQMGRALKFLRENSFFL